MTDQKRKKPDHQLIGFDYGRDGKPKIVTGVLLDSGTMTVKFDSPLDCNNPPTTGDWEKAKRLLDMKLADGTRSTLEFKKALHQKVKQSYYSTCFFPHE